MAAPLVVPRRLIRLEVPLMILVSFVMLLVAFDGRVSRLEGGILCAGFLTHLLFMLREQLGGAPVGQNGVKMSRRNWKDWARNASLVIAGLALLVIGSNWLVDGAVALARALGVSELILGLTIIAIGTSLPELATSIIAGLRGARDIAVGNIIGSNIFNLLAGLGLTALSAPGGVQVSQAALRFDIPVMIASAVACLPIFYIGHRISRWEGGLFFGYDIAYMIYLILTATRHHTASQFRIVMLWFVIPLTVVTLLIKCHRQRVQSAQDETPTPAQRLRRAFQSQLGHSFEQCVEGDLRLQSRQRCAQAVMNPVSEREVFIRLSFNVYRVGVLEHRFIPVRRPDYSEHHLPTRDRYPLNHHVLTGIAFGGHEYRRGVAK